MNETAVMESQEDKALSVVTSYNNVPYFIIADDLQELGQQDYVDEVAEINNYYAAYEDGMEFNTEGTNGEYVPSKIRFKKAASILNKEARFLFSNPPTFNVNIDDMDGDVADDNTILQEYLDNVLEKNNFKGQIIKAVKDCFIGKRCAIVLNFNSDKQEVSLMFLNSLEFIYKTASDNPTRLEKFICFHNTTSTTDKAKQVWFKKTYSLVDEVVYVDEHYYDGLGNILVDYPSIDNMKTELTEIPAAVILNDGLIGDTKGRSELTNLLDAEGVYSKLANEDIDIERKGMNPVAYTVDASQNSTKNLSRSPGSYWDLQTDYDQASDSPHQAKAGLLEPSMNHSGALKTTLDRLENEMYSQVDVPNVNSEKLMGVITSGKTISALYWGLVVRCDEKMLTWSPALTFIAKMIIEGGKIYTDCIEKYTDEDLPDIEYEILVENNYPLPEDVAEEKSMDISEVDNKLMSRKAYIKKWRNLSDKQAEEEILQIKAEQDLLDDGYVPYDNRGNKEEDDSIPSEDTQRPIEEQNDNQLDNNNIDGEDQGEGK
jgi:hypothetical protein